MSEASSGGVSSSASLTASTIATTWSSSALRISSLPISTCRGSPEMGSRPSRRSSPLCGLAQRLRLRASRAPRWSLRWPARAWCAARPRRRRRGHIPRPAASATPRCLPGDHGHLAGAAAHVDHDAGSRFVDGEARSDRCRQGFLDELNRAGAGGHAGLGQRSLLDVGDAGGRAHHHARAGVAAAVDAPHEMAQHLLRDLEVRDHTVTKRAHRGYARGVRPIMR